MEIAEISAYSALAISILTTIFNIIQQYKKEKVDNLSTKGDVADKISDAALQLLKPYKETVTELTNDLNENKLQVSDCLSKYSELKVNYEILNAENNNLKKRIEILENSKKENNILIRKLEQENGILSKKISELEKTNSLLTTENETLVNKIKTLEGKLKSIK